MSDEKETQPRRAEANQEKPRKAPLVTATRRLATATYALAFIALCSLIAAFLQWCALRGQLEEMKTESTFRRNELAAVMRLGIQREPSPGQWIITSQWINTGKTNADFSGWQYFKIFRTAEDYELLKNHSFILEPPGGSKILPRGTIVIPDNPIAIESWHIPESDAWGIVYGITMALLWGYAEYSDIFGEMYSIRYCDFFTFTLVGERLMIDLPHAFAAECTQRRQEHHR